MTDREDASAARAQMRIVIPPRQSKLRLDVYLARHVQNATRNKVRKAILDGDVRVDGKIVKPSYPVAPGDVIQITFSRPPPPKAEPEPIPLDIVFEDEHLLVVNKPAGMVTHPAYAHYSGTLVNALLHHCRSLSSVNTAMRPGIVHRLDKDTTGLMVVAKNDTVHHALAKQFARRTIDREYWALVWGRLRKDHGTIEASLGRSRKDRKKVTVVEAGKHAVTDFEVVERFEYLTLLRLKLKTGRTHQIRVHLAHIGHPVFGDPAYGGRSATWGGLTTAKARQASHLLAMIGRQALHARTIGFLHPATGGRVMLTSRLPADLQGVLDALRTP